MHKLNFTGEGLPLKQAIISKVALFKTVKKREKWDIYLTVTFDAAIRNPELAPGEGRLRSYLVEPTDPNNKNST